MHMYIHAHIHIYVGRYVRTYVVPCRHAGCMHAYVHTWFGVLGTATPRGVHRGSIKIVKMVMLLLKSATEQPRKPTALLALRSN